MHYHKNEQKYNSEQYFTIIFPKKKQRFITIVIDICDNNDYDTDDEFLFFVGKID
jgi:hypothetical protein